jgi:molybdenum cofactor cytidylyltransferase
MDTTDNMILILAAGEARRMGCAKQMLVYHGKPLLQSAVEKALATGTRVAVVLGAHMDQIRPAIQQFPLELIENANWKQGIGTSIKSGLDALLQSNSNLKGIIIVLADQPLVTTRHLKNIISEVKERNNQIIATTYQGVTGVPAYFPSSLFDDLLNLTRSSGAKSIIRANDHLVHRIAFEGAGVDIDTPRDWKEFIQGSAGLLF